MKGIPMNFTDEWVDPTDVYLHVHDTGQGLFGWAIAQAPSYDSGSDPQLCSGTADTRVDAVTAGLSRFLLDTTTPVNLYTEDASVHAAFADLATSWPHVELHSMHEAGRHRLRHACRTTAEDEATRSLPNADREPLVVAVDGSFSISQRTMGWAWVDVHGRHSAKASGPSGNRPGGTRTPGASPLMAELLAIHAALSSHPRGDLDVWSDCQAAIGLVTHPADSFPVKLVSVISRIQSMCEGRSVTFRWVPSHSGNPLNEAANRLAITARRAHEAGTPASTVATVKTSIVDECLSAYRNGETVEPTRGVPALISA